MTLFSVRMLNTSLAATLLVSSVQAQTSTVDFDNSGAESGITTVNTRNFSFQGSNWEGGEIQQTSDSKFQATGNASYVVADQATVSFDPPVRQLRMFFVHGDGFDPGSAQVISSDGTALAEFDSLAATTMGDTNNFVNADSMTAIGSVRFTGGVVDNFSYTAASSNFVMDQSIEGGWFFPETDGSGLLLDFIPGEPDRVFAAWFTYDAAGSSATGSAAVGDVGQRWLTALGEVTAPDTATLTVFNSSGGGFDAGDTVTSVEVGTMTIQFSSCREAQVSYELTSPSSQSGQFPIQPTDPSLADCDQPPE